MDPTLQRERLLAHHDYLCLTRMLLRGPAQAGAEAMQDLLDASDVLETRAVPPTLVTMHARVLLQDPGGDAPSYQLTLCLPHEADPAQGCVSVLSPVGSALLGLQVGETAQWQGPSGRSGAARILAVLSQPEPGGEVAA